MAVLTPGSLLASNLCHRSIPPVVDLFQIVNDLFLDLDLLDLFLRAVGNGFCAASMALSCISRT
jgi:hypothetical protein